MKKGKVKLVMFFLMGILFSGVTAFVVAESLINSKDVVYEDNSNLAADNVQDAIDGTCSKIDTRLSDIEDNLYTVKSIYTRGDFYNSTDLIYTGVSLTLPANSYCTITARLGWTNGRPVKVSINNSSTVATSSLASNEGNANPPAGTVSTTYSSYIRNSATVYVWARYDTGESYITNAVIDGFCATKYK